MSSRYMRMMGMGNMEADVLLVATVIHYGFESINNGSTPALPPAPVSPQRPPSVCCFPLGLRGKRGMLGHHHYP